MIDYHEKLVLTIAPLVWDDPPEYGEEWAYEGGPRVPDWLKDLVCSDAFLEEKRSKVEELITDEAQSESDPFVAWTVLALSKLHKDLDELRYQGYLGRDIHHHLGFHGGDKDFFNKMAAYVHRNGVLSSGYLDYCRRTNSKGVSHLGKYGDQIITLIALAAGCRQYVPPKKAKLLGIELPCKTHTRKKHEKQAECASTDSVQQAEGLNV